MKIKFAVAIMILFSSVSAISAVDPIEVGQSRFVGIPSNSVVMIENPDIASITQSDSGVSIVGVHVGKTYLIQMTGGTLSATPVEIVPQGYAVWLAQRSLVGLRQGSESGSLKAAIVYSGGDGNTRSRDTNGTSRYTWGVASMRLSGMTEWGNAETFAQFENNNANTGLVLFYARLNNPIGTFQIGNNWHVLSPLLGANFRSQGVQLSQVQWGGASWDFMGGDTGQPWWGSTVWASPQTHYGFAGVRVGKKLSQTVQFNGTLLNVNRLPQAGSKAFVLGSVELTARLRDWKIGNEFGLSHGKYAIQSSVGYETPTLRWISMYRSVDTGFENMNPISLVAGDRSMGSRITYQPSAQWQYAVGMDYWYYPGMTNGSTRFDGGINYRVGDEWDVSLGGFQVDNAGSFQGRTENSIRVGASKRCELDIFRPLRRIYTTYQPGTVSFENTAAQNSTTMVGAEFFTGGVAWNYEYKTETHSPSTVALAALQSHSVRLTPVTIPLGDVGIPILPFVLRFDGFGRRDTLQLSGAFSQSYGNQGTEMTSSSFDTTWTMRPDDGTTMYLRYSFRNYSGEAYSNLNQNAQLSFGISRSWDTNIDLSGQRVQVSGIVYHDLNHNGQLDPGEPGLSNIRISGSSDAVSDGSGNYSVSVAKGGWMRAGSTRLVSPFGSSQYQIDATQILNIPMVYERMVQWVVFVDQNGNGIWDESSEPLIPNVRGYLRVNGEVDPVDSPTGMGMLTIKTPIRSAELELDINRLPLNVTPVDGMTIRQPIQLDGDTPTIYYPVKYGVGQR